MITLFSFGFLSGVAFCILAVLLFVMIFGGNRG